MTVTFTSSNGDVSVDSTAEVTWNLALGNRRQVAMPEVGGTGPKLWFSAAVGFAVAACLAVWRRKRLS